MSKYATLSVVGSAANSAKAVFVGVEATLDLYVRAVQLAHNELTIIEERQAERLEEVRHELAIQSATNAAKRKKLLEFTEPSVEAQPA